MGAGPDPRSGLERPCAECGERLIWSFGHWRCYDPLYAEHRCSEVARLAYGLAQKAHASTDTWALDYVPERPARPTPWLLPVGRQTARQLVAPQTSPKPAAAVTPRNGRAPLPPPPPARPKQRIGDSAGLEV